MKALGILSLIIGILGTIVIIYFQHKAELRQKEFGVLISFFTYGSTNYFAILTAQIFGIVVGSIAIVKTKAILAICGLSICLLNLIHLLSHSA